MPTKVLVVDDSALMRKHLRAILEEDNAFQVVTARDGKDALEQIANENPDVVTLDINMPVMDGLECLARIMSEAPRPVVMVSSLTEKGATATFEALELGAVDYVAKPGGTMSLNIREAEQVIRTKVKAAARAARRRAPPQPAAPAAVPRRPARQATVKPAAATTGLVLIGVSTGGPTTLERILAALPAEFPWPVLIAQHMPGRFTNVFAQRLDTRCALQVREVDRPTPLQEGQILIGRGEADVVVGRRAGKLVALNMPSDASLWHPSVDRLVRSALAHYTPTKLIGVELTGMGVDGAAAMTELHAQGGRTIAESEASAVVFGMPKELIDRGGADVVLPASDVAAQLQKWLQ